jgi:hypothetical protein
MSIVRSAGSPSRDAVELKLVVAGWAVLAQDSSERETIRRTDSGVHLLADARQRASVTSSERIGPEGPMHSLSRHEN